MAYSPIRVAKTMTGANPPTEAFAPVAGSTFKVGQLLYLNSSGTVQIAEDAEAGAIGVALEAAVDENSGVLRSSVTVALADPNTLFSVDNTGADYVEATHRGVPYDYVLASNSCAVGTTGDAMLRVYGPDTTDVATTGGPRVLCSIPAAKSQAPGGSVARG